MAVQGLTVGVVTVVLFTLDVRLALITVVVVVPATAVLTLWFRAASDRTFGTVRDRIADVLAHLQEGLAALRKLRELLATEPSVAEDPAAVDLPPVEGEVRLEGVSFGYDAARPVLHAVDLRIAPGETLAVVGATGAGKSTIAKLVVRLYDPQAGRVLIDGHDLRAVTVSSLRGQLGVIPQEPFLFSGSMRDNL